MRNLITTLAGCIALLVCLSVNGAPATGKGYHLSGVSGQVQGGILFHQWNVLVKTETGDMAADILTDAEGNFVVDLKPGTYVLVAYILNFGPYPVVLGTPMSVTVEKKQFEPVILSITLPPL